MTKYIFVTGGVVSSLGKGIAASSIGRLLKSRGLNVVQQKFDPYINVDAGLISPWQHGEVFITDDGGETDLDIGHYERFTDVNLSRNNSMTTGKVYQTVLNKERHGEFGGGTVQVIPHITNEVKKRMQESARTAAPDVIITEIGGTVGDIESLPFLEAIRQLKNDLGRGNVLYVHCTLVPYIKAAGEVKTKPTQHSVKELRSIGIQPDVIVCRGENPLEQEVLDKISLFCDVPKEAVVDCPDAKTIYEVPLILQKQGLDDYIALKLGLELKPADLAEWSAMVASINKLSKTVKIGLVGKYVKLQDAYLSLNEALSHAALIFERKTDIAWIDAAEVNGKNVAKICAGLDCLVIPPDDGILGVEGKIATIAFARENDIPLLAIDQGMQLMLLEYAKNVCGLNVVSSEFEKDEQNEIIKRVSQVLQNDGDNRRMGSFPCAIKPGSKVAEAYNNVETVYERHVQSYRINNAYKDILKEHGLAISAVSPDGLVIEAIELSEKNFFVGCQFQPQFKSRPNRAHGLFRLLMEKSIKQGVVK